MKSRYRIITRKYPDGRKRFIARYLDSAGKVVRSETISEATTARKAADIARERVAGGIASDNPEALSYILEFWTSESVYASKRERSGKPLSYRYLYGNRGVVSKHFAACLRGRRLLDLTPAILETQAAKLARKGVGARVINRGLQAIARPTRWYCRKNRLADPLVYLEREEEHRRERGVLSLEEVRQIVASKGEIGAAPRPESQKTGPGLANVAPNVYAAVLLGALCGLRLGEVRGLQFDDVDAEKGLIHVLHNYVDDPEGLKAPKWRSSRTVPAPPMVLEAIERCRILAKGPFVYYHASRADKPAGTVPVRDGFRKILRALGIDEAEQERRNLVFHGLRHFYVSTLRAAGVADYLVGALVGHRNLRTTEGYSHTENVLDFQAARSKLAEAVTTEAGVKKAGG